MALLMEQRATFIAQLAYKRAVDSARKELEERERAEGRGQTKGDSSEPNGDGTHAIEMESKETPTKVRDMTAKEKDALVTARAAEIIQENATNEEVLFDGRAVKGALPVDAAEYRRRGDRSEEKEAVEEEMGREANGQVERSRSGNRDISTSDGGKGGMLQDEEES